MENIIVGVVMLLMIGAAIVYVVRAKKKGQKCIGCPYSDTCPSKKANVSCGCGCSETSENE